MGRIGLKDDRQFSKVHNKKYLANYLKNNNIFI